MSLPLLPMSAVRRLLVPTQWARAFELHRASEGSHLRSMEGLRGFAVTLVFLVHYTTLVSRLSGQTGPAAGLLEAVHAIGNAGVDLFFVLSGCLIYGALIRRPVRFAHYARRRIGRIYPTFAVVLCVYLLLSVVVPSQSKLPVGVGAIAIYVVQNLLLLPGIFAIDPIITVAWSLSYEMFFYLVSPLVIAVLSLRSWAPKGRVAFIVGAAVVLLAAMPPSGPVRLIMFLAGMLVHETVVLRPRVAPSSPVAFLALGAALGSLALPAAASPYPLKLVALFVGFGVLCVACFARPQSTVARAFGWTPLRWLGNMSYSYYLVHGLALNAIFMGMAHFAPGLHGAMAEAGLLMPVFLLTLVPSAFVFLAVERPLSLDGHAGVRTPAAGSPVRIA